MKKVLPFLLMFLPASAGAITAPPIAGGMVQVTEGVLRPFYPENPQEKEIPVKTFWIDRLPVTNEQFLNFVKKLPQWRRDKVSRLFADIDYLKQWKSALSLELENSKGQPVTKVSWFAAKAYCESQGARLPTNNEWEYSAQASETVANARDDMVWRNRVLDWYTKPAPKTLPQVGLTPPNYWGIFDLHGLVWEWVSDFSATMITSESREGGDAKLAKFCGAGALAASDKDDYPTFMRMAFKSSLKASYTTGNLGFRCARDQGNDK